MEAFWALQIQACLVPIMAYSRNTLTMTKVHWPWPKYTDHDQSTLTMTKVHWPWPKYADHDQNTLTMTKVYWPWTKYADRDQSTLTMTKKDKNGINRIMDNILKRTLMISPSTPREILYIETGNITKLPECGDLCGNITEFGVSESDPPRSRTMWYCHTDLQMKVVLFLYPTV